MEVKGLAAFAALVLVGCGSSEPQHEVQPLTARPPASGNFTKLSTPDEKIKFIQDSKAPEAEKKKAIEQVQAGKL